MRRALRHPGLGHQKASDPRAAFLAQECADDPRALARARALLARDDTLDGFLEQPLLADTRPAAGQGLEEPRQLGDFRLLRELGRGGMGTVFLAEQDRPIRRQVALKLLRTRYLHHEGALRFDAEGQALARMSHPGIAQIFEVGSSEDGPYIVLEYIEGLTIDRFCDRHRLSPDRRLELFLAVCDGVRHAHQKGIIHRDIKPSNVLVTGSAEKPLPKLIDFGIAKSFDQPLIEETLVTGDGLMGTPAYLSPEMIDGAEVDVRSDVYGLGILLFQLMVGRPPFPARDTSLLELLRQIREDPVPRLDKFLHSLADEYASEIANLRDTTRSALDRYVRNELSWIVGMATAKEPEKRYGSVSELAADVDRFRRHEAVLAGPPSAAYRARKFMRRHRVWAVAAALVFLTLIGGLAGMAIEAERANREARLAAATLEFMTDVFMGSSPATSRDRRPTAEDLLQRGASAARQRLADQPLALAQLLSAMGSVYTYLARYPEAEALAQDVLEIRTRELGENHSQVAVAAWHRAKLHRIRGQLEAAESMARRAVEIGERGDVEPRELASMLRELAVVHLYQSRYPEAQSVLERALTIAESVAGEDDHELSMLVEDLGRAYGLQGDLVAAERMARRVLAIRSTVLAPDHPAQAIAAGRLGEILMAQGRLEEAEPELSRAVEVARQAFGPKHNSVSGHLLHLGGLRARQKRFQEAEDLYLDALAIKRQSVGPEHFEVSLVINNIGALYWRQGRYADAEPYYRQALDLKIKTLGEEHSRVAISMSNVGEVWWKLGRLDEAEPMLRRALEIQGRTLGEDHLDRGFPLHALAMLNREREQFTEAETLFAEVFALRTKHAEADDPDLQDTRREYAALLEMLGRGEEARKILASSAL